MDDTSPSAMGAPAKDVPCAYCDTSVVGHAFVLCAVCEVPVHRDCWAEALTCPAYGCGNKRPLDPAEAIFRRKGSPALLGPGTAPDAPTSAMAIATTAAANVFSAAAKSVAAVANAATQALAPRPATVPSLSREERRAEIRRLEARLYELQLRRWKRTTVLMAFVMLLPLVLRFIARPLIFPWMIAVVAYASWPGHRESSRRHERALRQRLEQLEVAELGP